MAKISTRAQSHRQRDYGFDPKKFTADFPPPPAVEGPAKNVDVLRLAAYIGEWMRDMKAWGEDVRDDVIRLESAVHAAPGDPGDPPPAPRAK